MTALINSDEKMTTKSMCTRSDSKFYICIMMALIEGCTYSAINSDPLEQNKYKASNGGIYWLDKQLITVKAKKHGPTAQCKLEIEAVTLLNVNDIPFMLDFDFSALSEDKAVVTWDTHQKITKIEFTADDKTAAVAENLAKFAAVLIAKAPLPITPTTGGEQLVCEEKNNLYFTFDPFKDKSFNKDEMSLDPLNNWLKEIDVTYIQTDDKTNSKKRVITEYKALLTSESGVQPTEPKSTPQKCREGLCYRPAFPYKLEISQKAENEETWSFLRADIVEMTNNSPILSLDIERTRFVKRQTTYDLTAQAGPSLTITKPSEAQEISKVPLNIANLIANIPAQALQFTLNQNKSIKEISDNQKAVELNKLAIQKEVYEQLNKKLSDSESLRHLSTANTQGEQASVNNNLGGAVKVISDIETLKKSLNQTGNANPDVLKQLDALEAQIKTESQ